MIRVASKEHAEACDFTVCLPASWAHCAYFADNEHGRCSRCECAVMFRPYVPKRPKKLCMRCFALRLEESGKPDLLDIARLLKAHIEQQEQAAKQFMAMLALRG